MKIQLGFLDLQHRFDQLSKGGDALKRLNAIVDWEMFRPDLESIDRKERKSAAGRKPTDRVRMFKMLALQNLHGLSDNAIEYQVTDRLTFTRFLGIDLGGAVPDAKTVWLLREQLREENETIKEGAVPVQWTKNPAKLRQKDTDARWTQKNDEDHFGYKSHVSVDRKTRLVISERATPANVHDSQVFDGLLGKAGRRGRDVWADSAYRSREHERGLKRRGFRSAVHERGSRGHPLTAVQQRRNRTKSRVRVRVEHVFATMTQMGGMFVRSIGLERMRAWSTMKTLTYNLKRLEALIRLGKLPIDGIGVPG